MNIAVATKEGGIHRPATQREIDAKAAMDAEWAASKSARDAEAAQKAKERQALQELIQERVAAIEARQ